MSSETSQHDVVDVLSTDHDEFLSLIQQIRDTTDPQSQRDLTDTLIAEIIRHAVAEEMWVYPAMESHLPDGKAASEHDREEHAEMEALMKRMEDSDPLDAEFIRLIDELEEVLRDHIDDEEDDHFPRLRAHVPGDELIDMAGKVEGTKKIAPTRPHPSAPNSELFHKTVGTGVGMIDRLRDKLTGGPMQQ